MWSANHVAIGKLVESFKDAGGVIAWGHIRSHEKSAGLTLFTANILGFLKAALIPCGTERPCFTIPSGERHWLSIFRKCFMRKKRGRAAKARPQFRCVQGESPVRICRSRTGPVSTVSFRGQAEIIGQTQVRLQAFLTGFWPAQLSLSKPLPCRH